MAKKARNPRVVAMEVIKVMSGNVAAMKARWSWVPSTSYGLDEAGKYVRRDRARKDIPAAEYRENDPAEWALLASFMDVVAKQAQDVAGFARQQERAAHARLQPPPRQCTACDHGHEEGVTCAVITPATGSGFSPWCGCQS